MARPSLARRLLFPCVVYALAVVYSLVAMLRVLFTILRRPGTALKKTPRDVPPACLLDPSLGSHEYVTANGIKFHYVAAGDKSKPLMLFLHGFPEFWFSWRHQLQEFCKDYRVVAIDMRGYSETERPLHKQDYQMDKLKQDVVELIPALGYTSCTLVAHDWGGVVAWRVVQRHPELVDRFIVMNCPHPKAYIRQMKKGWGQFLKSWYMFLFQVPWLPEFFIGLRDYGQFNAMFRGKQMGVRNRAAFPTEILEAYKYTFSKPGALTAPLNYYRCMFSVPLSKESAKTPIAVPTLIIWGDDDGALETAMADDHASLVSDLTVRHIPNCSHWVQQDAPDLVNKYMREWLEAKSG